MGGEETEGSVGEETVGRVGGEETVGRVGGEKKVEGVGGKESGYRRVGEDRVGGV